MQEDIDSKEQELPPWKSEDPTPAGAAAIDMNDSNPQPLVIKSNDSKGCCQNLMSKCGPIGWYFRPVFGHFLYSTCTTFYHLIMFAYTLAVFIIVVTLFSVSVGLLVLVFGFILFWWTCEISVVLARIDLALAYYMVEDNAQFIKNSKHLLQLNLYRRVTACPCSQDSRRQGGSFCSRLLSRMKSIACQCEMVKIFIFQMIIKPIVVQLTCWIFVVVIYVFASVFAPIVYIISSRVFTRHYWCPLGGESCDGGHCTCEVIGINDFWGALLYGTIAFLLLPLVLRISIWFAKFSKATSYYFISNYYNSHSLDPERNSLIVEKVREDSISKDNNATPANPVHSINNPYVNDV